MDMQAIKARRYAPVAIPDDLFELQGNTIYLHPEFRGVSCRQTEGGQWYIVFMGSSNIARFLANAPADIDALVKRVEALEAERDLITEVDDALYWLLNLLHGMSKGGPEFSPPSDAEWAEAIETGKTIHDKVENSVC